MKVLTNVRQMRPRSTVAALVMLLACQQDPTSAGCCAPVRITLSASGMSLGVGEKIQLLAWTVDTRGQVASASPDWKTADPAIATISEEGLVTAMLPGNTTLTATIGTLHATATVSVRPAGPPVALVISPASLTLVAGDTARLSAIASDSAGRPTSASLEWSSADPGIATIGRTDGVVTAVANGRTTMTVAVGALRATSQVVVSTPTLAFTFSRTTSLGRGEYRSEAFTYVNGRIEPLQVGQFTSVAAPSWSPDGLQLAIEVIHGFVEGGEWLEYNSDLYVADATSPVGWRALTTNGLSTSPTWSPDGRRIAYVEKTALYGHTHIRIADIGGGTPITLSLSPGWYGKPCWSPDGLRLAFSGSVAGASGGVIFVVDADGSNLKALPTPTGDYSPCWSPDGTKLVFVRFRMESSGAFFTDLSTRDLDGGNVVRLFSSRSFVSLPTWSPDGRQILFSSTGALYVVNADGSALIRLTTPSPNASDEAPAWKR